MSIRKSIRSSPRRTTRRSTRLEKEEEKETSVSPVKNETVKSVKEEETRGVNPVENEESVNPVKEDEISGVNPVKNEETRGVRGSPVENELILTPPTPDITQAILEKKPWLSNEFFDLAIEKLGLKIERSTNPKLLVLVGPPAAGKSTVKRQLGFQNAVNLDVDEFKILGVKEFGQKAKGMFGDFRKIIQLLSVKIIDQGLDFILDTTGKMKEEIKYVMKKAKAASYTIDVAIVYSTMELCKTRVAKRNIEYTQRDPMPIRVVEKTYEEFTTSKLTKSYLLGMKDVISMVDNFYLFDNSRCTPDAALIMEKHGQQTVVHEDFPDFYGVSISQLSPKLVAKGITKSNSTKSNSTKSNSTKSKSTKSNSTKSKKHYKKKKQNKRR
jgi:predicted kinase